MTFMLDRLHLFAALIYAVLGLGLGIYMAASHNHSQTVAHAHLLLVGFVLSFIYAVIMRLWLYEPPRILCVLQFVGHHLGTIVLVSGLLLLYGGVLPMDTLEPWLASSSLLVLSALAVMCVMVCRRQVVALPPLEGEA